MNVRIVNVRYTGGLVGLLMPRDQALKTTIQSNLDQGLVLTHVLPPRSSLVGWLLALLLLACTLGLFTVESGEKLVFQPSGA